MLNSDPNTPLLPRRVLVALLIFLGCIAVLVVGPDLLTVYTDALWFGAVGYPSVWATVIVTRLLLFVGVTLLVGTGLWAALRWAFRHHRPLFTAEPAVDGWTRGARTAVLTHPRLFVIGIPVILALPFGLHAPANWTTVQLFLHGGTSAPLMPNSVTTSASTFSICRATGSPSIGCSSRCFWRWRAAAPCTISSAGSVSRLRPASASSLTLARIQLAVLGGLLRRAPPSPKPSTRSSAPELEMPTPHPPRAARHRLHRSLDHLHAVADRYQQVDGSTR
jgi:hypothetical protein